MRDKFNKMMDAFIFDWDEKEKALLILKLSLLLAMLYVPIIGTIYISDPFKVLAQLDLKTFDRYFMFWVSFLLLFLSMQLYVMVIGKEKVSNNFPNLIVYVTGAWFLGLLHWIGSISSVIICIIPTILALAVPFFGKRAFLFSILAHVALFALLTIEYLGILPYAPLGVNTEYEDIMTIGGILPAVFWIITTSAMVYLFSSRLYSRLEQVQKDLKKQYELVQIEQSKNEVLLANILPQKVISDLKEKGQTAPETFSNVSVFFSDIVGFTSISSSLEPAILIKELSQMFTDFDTIMESHGCERIKTIGDAYLAVSGLDGGSPTENASKMVCAALEIIELLHTSQQNEIFWKIRIGIHSGDIVGGIVGKKKYIYDIFGDTVNTASRMESNSDVMRINVSDSTQALISDAFSFEDRGQFQIKGKGSMKMYFVEGPI
jgi:class 3 adenylate cyclase